MFLDGIAGHAFARVALTGVAVLLASMAHAAVLPEYQEDFTFLWHEIASRYAYFDLKATRWNDIPAIYADDLYRVETKRQFVDLLEHVMDELYDAHAQLGVNTPTSSRIVPSGTDIWAEWHGGKAVVSEVRDGSDAQHAGVHVGDTVVVLNGVAIGELVDRRMGRTYPHSDSAARDWALRSVLAGTHGASRVLELGTPAGSRTVELPARDQYGEPAATALSYSELRPGIGYIRLHDSLGSSSTIAAFDHALDVLRSARAVIIDLRDTPSGGNTTVARGILGRFVQQERPYQKHVLPAEERETGIRRSWLELVSPRGSFAYAGRVIVLVDHWTGSMGEGLAVGFDAATRATVVGTPMAGLLGATYHVTLPHTRISVNVPSERLYHVDGIPREQYRPAVLVGVSAATGEDPFIAAALRLIADSKQPERAPGEPAKRE